MIGRLKTRLAGLAPLHVSTEFAQTFISTPWVTTPIVSPPSFQIATQGNDPADPGATARRGWGRRK
eukprot:1055565-Pyramimonas_sp.AAC.1